MNVTTYVQDLGPASRRALFALLVLATAFSCLTVPPARVFLAEIPGPQIVEILAEEKVVTQRERQGVSPAPPATVGLTARRSVLPPALPVRSAPREIDSQNGCGAPLLC